MASIYDLKPRFQDLLRPFSDKLVNKGATANHVTLAAVGLSILMGAVLFIGRQYPGLYLLVPPFLFFRMGLNAIDGMMAREHNMKTPAGSMLNELGDVVSDAFLYLPFALMPGISSPLIVVIVLLSVVSEMTGVVAAVAGADRRYDGPMGKSDRAFVFSCIALLIGVGVDVGVWMNILLCIILLLLAVTIGNRFKNAVRQLKP